MSSKKHYIGLDLIRVLACLMVLLYHLNILKGGYLAVCVFFCLSGYLSIISAFKKERFSLGSYYLNRLLKLYLPLIIVVFITIFIASLLPNISWFNLKPETTSVVLGYNNFWQLDANLDYFARHINSPFMHLWYIGILLQFDLVFPFIYMFFRKIGDKINKSIPCLLLTFISAGLFIYFYMMSNTPDIMSVYYNTFTRLFSILFGVTLGFIHMYVKVLIPEKFKGKCISKIIFLFYLIILIALSIFIDASSSYFALAMGLTSLITCRLIDYGTINLTYPVYFHERLVNYLSSICYEIYLVQYPVIFFFQNIDIYGNLKILVIILITILVSCLLHMCISFKRKEKNKIIKYLLRFLILSITIYGGYKYVVAKDHTLEMKELETQLAFNQNIIEQKQKEYEANLKQEQEDWMNTLKDLENSENELKDIVSNLRVTGIGDSVMLGAVNNLYETFPNGYFDAAVSRTPWVLNDIVVDLKNKNILGDVVVLNLGANGDCSTDCKREIVESIGNRKIFWLNVTNDEDVHINAKLVEFSKQYNNLYIVDWSSISKGHDEYFYADGIHLTGPGRVAYSKAIYDSIYQVYLDEFNQKKNEILNKYEEDKKNRISFYGNDILLNVFDYIKDDYKDAKYNINSSYDFDILKNDIIDAIKEDTLNYKVVFAFDDSIHLNLDDYQELIELCNNYEVYILSINSKTNKLLNNKNVKVIDFYSEILRNSDYLMVDKIHLSKEGNIALDKFLNDIL